jgi:hypothetical protein
MRYTLWSHGRLVGHTDLDIHTVTPTMRQGFIEPTEEGRPLLADATSVWRAIAEMKRERRARGQTREHDDHSLVLAAMARREALDLELRDETGALFEVDFIRVNDLFDMENGIVDEMSETPEEEEAEFQIRLSALPPEEKAKALAERAEMDADIEADVETMLAQLQEEQDEQDEQEALGSAWPPAPPEDPRWNTMQYFLQAHLNAPAWEVDTPPLPM